MFRLICYPKVIPFGDISIRKLQLHSELGLDSQDFEKNFLRNSSLYIIFFSGIFFRHLHNYVFRSWEFESKLEFFLQNFHYLSERLASLGILEAQLSHPPAL